MIAYSWLSYDFATIIRDDKKFGNFRSEKDMMFYILAFLGCFIMALMCFSNFLFMAAFLKSPQILLNMKVMKTVTYFYFIGVYFECIILGLIAHLGAFV